MLQLNAIMMIKLILNGIELGVVLTLVTYYTMYKTYKANFHRYFVAVLLLAAFVTVVDQIFTFMGLMDDVFYMKWYSSLCLYSIPVVAVFVASVFRPALSNKQLARRMGLMLLGSLSLTALFVLTKIDLFFYLGFVYGILLLVAFASRLPIWVKSYYRQLLNTYSFVGKKSLHWMQFVLSLYIIYIVVFVLSTFLLSQKFDLVFEAATIILLLLFNHFVNEQDVVDAQSMMETVDDKEGEGENIPEMSEAGGLQDLAEIDISLTNALVTKQMFLNPNLTIEDVARELGTNIRYLSFYLNSIKNTNFNIYVNNLRLDYACSLMKAHPLMELEDLYLRCGFNTMITFNRAFRKQYGLNAKEFHDRMLQEDPDVMSKMSANREKQCIQDMLEGKDPMTTFFPYFKSEYPNFLQNLMESEQKLSQKEQLLCMLIFTNQDNATIAQVMRMTRESLRVTKSRLNAKLNADKRYASLAQYLQNVAGKPFQS